MIVVMKPGSTLEEIERVIQELQSWNITPIKSVGQHKAIVGLIGDTADIDPKQIQNLSPWIEQVVRVKKPFKRASLEFRSGQTTEVVVSTPNELVSFGQNHPLVVLAGFCSIENEEMIVKTAQRVKAAGAKFLCGGAYKPRTSPYAFQGDGDSALLFLDKAREATGLGIITEVMDTTDIEKVAFVADVLQIGARNMQNFSLLKKVSATGKPILLKRGLSATIEEWLMSAEYILSAGNPNVILCERGIRTLASQYTGNILDISAIPVLRSLTHLPIAIEPSHGAGKGEFVPTMAKAAVAAGVNALMIEVNPNPTKAFADGSQPLTREGFEEFMQEIPTLAKTVGHCPQRRRHLSVVS